LTECLLVTQLSSKAEPRFNELCGLRQIAFTRAKAGKEGEEPIYTFKNHDCHWADFAETYACSTNFCKELPYEIP